MTEEVTPRTPGFYLKMAVCDEHGNEVVTNELIKILTGREFYDLRMIPANVALTYGNFANFMNYASTGVTLIDAITTFSRCNYVPSKPAWTVNSDGTMYAVAAETLAAVVNTLRDRVKSEMGLDPAEEGK